MRVAFVNAQRHLDAVHEPPRGGIQLGPLFMASLLLEKGYDVHYMDESVREGGWNRREMSMRRLRPNQDKIKETPCEQSWEDIQREKMTDFRAMDAKQFIEKWSAFKADGSVERHIARIGVSEEETIERLRSLNVDVVGIPLTASANYLSATSLSRAIKRDLPRVRVVMGGQHITADPDEFLRSNPWVDYVASGDAITTIEKMVLGQPLNRIVTGGFQTMNQYPLMNCALLAEAGYPERPTHNPSSGLSWVGWVASRGCYRNCAFCFAGRKEQLVTQSTWDRIRAQLDHFVAHGVKEIILQDDALLLQAKKFFIPLLGEMKLRGLSFSDNGGLEFENFSAEVADAIVQYNTDPRPGRCTSLYVPFNPREWNRSESAAGSMVRRHHRNLDNLAKVRASGVYTFSSLIVGAPDQTPTSYEEDLAVSRSLIQDGCLDLILPLSATMLPGTEWHNRNGHNIVHPEDWAGYNLFSTHHRTHHMSPREIEECMVHAVQHLSDIQTVERWGCAYT